MGDFWNIWNNNSTKWKRGWMIQLVKLPEITVRNIKTFVLDIRQILVIRQQGKTSAKLWIFFFFITCWCLSVSSAAQQNFSNVVEPLSPYSCTSHSSCETHIHMPIFFCVRITLNYLQITLTTCQQIAC